MKKTSKRELTATQREELLLTLRARFEKNAKRHKGIKWEDVEQRLAGKQADKEKLWSLNEMERTGGEPDVVQYDSKTGEYVFYDCAAETPKGRRSLCYDHEALEARKDHKPADSAQNMAETMGIEMLDEAQYRALQQLGPVDTKTSSWLKTPAAIRDLGGAIFGDYRYGQVFIYHNGAESYYAARAFRGALRV
jgi:hypothetical protein